MTIVKYQNDLNTISFRGLRPVDMDLFWAIASQVKDKGTQELFFSREDIYKLANYDGLHRSSAAFVKDMKIMSKKLMALNTELDDGNGGSIMFVLFPKFHVTPEGVRLKIAEEFAPWFNAVTGGFTRFELEAIIHLKSGYAKELFRHLMQFKSTGFMKWTTDDLRTKLAVPSSYKVGEIDRTILNVAKKELLEKDELGNRILDSLTIKKIKGGYRNLQITHYEFNFKVATEKILSVDSAEVQQLEYVKKSRIKHEFKKQKIVRREPTPDWLKNQQAVSGGYLEPNTALEDSQKEHVYIQKIEEISTRRDDTMASFDARKFSFDRAMGNLKYIPEGKPYEDEIKKIKKNFPDLYEKHGNDYDLRPYKTEQELLKEAARRNKV